MMKAVVYDKFGPPESLELREIQRPVPGDNDVLVRVEAAALNPADWHLLTGTPYVARVEFGLRTPKRSVPGTDVAGVVEAVGSNVSQLSIGDAVYGFNGGGCLAEYVAVPQKQLMLRPGNVSAEQAATMGVAAFTALQGIRDKGKVVAGQKVLITGASGGVGTFAVQIAKSLGAEVTAVCGTRNVEMVQSIGADRVIDYEHHDYVEVAGQHDLVFDLVGNRSLSDCRKVLAADGIYVMVGGPKSNWFGPIPRLLRALTMSLFISQKFLAFIANETQEDLAILNGLLESRRVTPVIARTYPLGEAAAAMRYQGDGHANGKIVMIP